jgi:cytochrome bd-type quinol oxidase subunit 2
MLVWLILITGSLGTGYCFGRWAPMKASLVAAMLVPWLVLLAAILITEAVVPYQGGGASMWIIAQLVGGSIAALLGRVGHRVGRRHTASRSST